MKIAIPDYKIVPVAQLKEAQQNANELEPEDFNKLVGVIKKHGFFQPICVRPLEGGMYEVVDGHHRLKAGKKLGMKAIPCVVGDDIDKVKAMALSLAMNRIKGETNLTVASDMLKQLAAVGMQMPDLVGLGFEEDALKALLAIEVQALPDEDDDGIEPQQVQSSKKYQLKLLFDREEDRDSVREMLLESGDTVEAGAMSIARKLKGGDDVTAARQ